MFLLDRLLDSSELTPALAIGLLIYFLSGLYVMFSVIARKDNYIWIAISLAAPPTTALMYYLQKRRERSNKTLNMKN